MARGVDEGLARIGSRAPSDWRRVGEIEYDRYPVQKFLSASWDNEPHSIAEQRSISARQAGVEPA